MTEPIASKATGKSRRLVFLLEPLGWVQGRLTNPIACEPALIDLVFDLDQPRMHLAALALAHLPSDVPPDVALLVLRGPRNAILNLSVGHRPVGIGRALHHLPAKVLPAETYRNLVDLLNDPVTGKFLHHHTGSITEVMITGLHSLPPALRSAAIMPMFNRIDGMTRFVDGLRFLAARAGLPFDILANQIGGLDQPDQVAAKIRQVVERLPLPDALPPPAIGGFRRLDTAVEIRDLAKKWQNCLAGYLFNVNHGTSAIYLSDQLKAVCFLARHGRMGWLLVQTKGPKNVDTAPDQLVEIHAAFATAGIPPSSIIEAIKSIVLTHEWSRHWQIPDDDDEIFDGIELY